MIPLTFVTGTLKAGALALYGRGFRKPQRRSVHWSVCLPAYGAAAHWLGDCRLFALCPRHIPTKRRDGNHPIGGLGDREIRLAKKKSLGSVLCGITCSLTGVCALAMHFTHWHEDVMTRLIFVGLCLGAGLILLDRRADGWSP
jgi:hypothetical protein